MTKPRHLAVADPALLTEDAKNRALRTFVQGFLTDLVAALAVWVVPLVSNLEGWEDFQWSFIGLMFVKTLVLTAFSFVMRRFVDGSGLPTPLPPAPVAEPAEEADAA